MKVIMLINMDTNNILKIPSKNLCIHVHPRSTISQVTDEKTGYLFLLKISLGISIGVTER